MIILRLHQEGITRDRNHPEEAGESTVQMKSNFFVLSSGANLERHTHTSFRFMSVFRKYPTRRARLTSFIWGLSGGRTSLQIKSWHARIPLKTSDHTTEGADGG